VAAGAGDGGGPELLAQALLRCYLSNLVALHVHPPAPARDVGPRPVASALARLQADADGRVTNLRHRLVRLNDLDRFVLRLLDGRRDRTALQEVLAAAVAEGQLVLHSDGRPLPQAGGERAVLADLLDVSLSRMAHNSLLVG
jgi:methyltransferase-like protein